jgi:hypothetical protein
MGYYLSNNVLPMVYQCLTIVLPMFYECFINGNIGSRAQKDEIGGLMAIMIQMHWYHAC